MNRFVKLAGAAAVATALSAGALATASVATASPASPVPPSPTKALYGTWVNVNTHTRSVKQIVVAPARTGSVSVDAFGACSPTLCQWGAVNAITYAPNVSTTTGATFQSNQAFVSNKKEWSRTTLTGTLARTTLGTRLVVRELTVFEDGSGRHNYAATELFALGKGLRATTAGIPVTTYRLGTPPALVRDAFGTWKNASANGNIAKLTISGTLAHPIVHGYGACSPTACDWGAVRGITYGAGIASTSGATLLAPYMFGFKNSQLLITHYGSGHSARLSVTMFSEFTDGSHRSNYVLTETLVRA